MPAIILIATTLCILVSAVRGEGEMSEEVKPCPFCGSDPKMCSRPLSNGNGEYVAYVKCGCGAVGPTFGYREREGALVAAKSAWNMRA
jgi:hypothetical protein